MHHCNRIEGASRYICAPIKFDVARHFHSEGWISKQTLQETLSTNRCVNHTGSVPLFYDNEHRDIVDDCKSSELHIMESQMEDVSFFFYRDRNMIERDNIIGS